MHEDKIQLSQIWAYRLRMRVTTPFGVISIDFPQNLILGCTAPWKTKKSDSTWKALTGGWWLTCSQTTRMPRSGLQVTSHAAQTINSCCYYSICSRLLPPSIYTSYCTQSLRDGYGAGLWLKGCRFDSPTFSFHMSKLGKLSTHVPGTRQIAVAIKLNPKQSSLLSN